MIMVKVKIYAQVRTTYIEGGQALENCIYTQAMQAAPPSNWVDIFLQLARSLRL